MSKLLYCKNQPVYNVDTNEILNEALVPYLILCNPTKEQFTKWMKYRYSAGSNTFSRMLKSFTFGQGNRKEINDMTYMLSYYDCYWMKDESNPIKFEDVSPYYSKFWNGTGEYKGGAVPTLYVPGYLSKEWRPNGKLFKEGNLSIEIDCIDLCKQCGIAVENGRTVSNGIELDNFTTPDVMLEQADVSGRIDPDDFTEEDVRDIFGIDGIKMQTIDAIIGNGDRHAGNFGFLKDANTGEILGMSPLYDFDHALDDSSSVVNKYFMQTLLDIEDISYLDEILRICEAASHSSNEIFVARANYIYQEIENHRDTIIEDVKCADGLNIRELF